MIPAIMPDDQDAPEIAKRSGINDPAVERRDDRGAGNSAEAQAVIRRLRRAGLAARPARSCRPPAAREAARRHGALFGPLLPPLGWRTARPPQAPIPAAASAIRSAGSGRRSAAAACLPRDLPVRLRSRCAALSLGGFGALDQLATGSSRRVPCRRRAARRRCPRGDISRSSALRRATAPRAVRARPRAPARAAASSVFPARSAAAAHRAARSRRSARAAGRAVPGRLRASAPRRAAARSAALRERRRRAADCARDAAGRRAGFPVRHGSLQVAAARVGIAAEQVEFVPDRGKRPLAFLNPSRRGDRLPPRRVKSFGRGGRLGSACGAAGGVCAISGERRRLPPRPSPRTEPEETVRLRRCRRFRRHRQGRQHRTAKPRRRRVRRSVPGREPRSAPR